MAHLQDDRDEDAEAYQEERETAQYEAYQDRTANSNY